MPASNTPFSPTTPTVRLAVTATSSASAINADNAQIRFYNAGPNKCLVRWGTGAQTALTTDTPIAPGVTEIFSKALGVNNVAAICDASETATLFVTTGEGS